MTRVLVATDGSDLAIAAAQHAVSLLPAGTEYTVLTVVRPPTFVAGAEVGIAPAVAVDSALISEAQHAADDGGQADATATAAQLGIPASDRVAHGDPGTVICQVAEDEAFDLIVLGSHGSGVIKRVLLGVTTYFTTRRAQCS